MSASHSAYQSGSIQTPANATDMASGRLRLQRRSSETFHDTSAIPSVAMGVLIELDVAEPVPTLNAPTVSRQLQQGLWACAEATDVLRCHFRSQRPGDVTAMPDLLNRCQKRDLAAALELALDLTMQGPRVGFHGQEAVGPLLLELLKNGFWVCRASA